jgi:hypothetical protein
LNAYRLRFECSECAHGEGSLNNIGVVQMSLFVARSRAVTNAC